MPYNDADASVRTQPSATSVRSRAWALLRGMSSASLISRSRAGSSRDARYSSSSTVRVADFTFRTARSGAGSWVIVTSQTAISSRTISTTAPTADTPIANHRSRFRSRKRFRCRDST